MNRDELKRLLLLPKSEGGINQIQESGFAKMFPEEYAELCGIDFPNGFTFRQKLYHWLNGDFGLALGFCKKCGKRCSFKNLSKGYFEYCSNSCAQSSEENIKKVKATKLERYGEENYNNREKSKRTCMEAYGVDNPLKSGAVVKKGKLTKLERYGDENYNNRKKASDTKLEKYGDSAYNNQQKYKQTCIEKYGVENVFQLQSVSEKIHNTMMDKYGVGHSMQSPVFQEKAKDTNRKRYGSDYVMQNDEVKHKSRDTNIEKYGHPCSLQNDEVKEKARNTMVEKYGVEHNSQTKEFWEKYKDTCVEKYGVEHPSMSEGVKDKMKHTCIERYGVEYASQSDEFKKRVMETNRRLYGVDWYCMTSECRLHGNDSKVNLNFAKTLEDSKISFEREFPLEGYSYDFKVGNVLIELNPTITHNSAVNIYGGNPKDENYHFAKSNTAELHGLSCIHIWDWDDKAKIVRMLKPKTILYARKLVLREVDTVSCDRFLNEHHLQNTCKGQSVCLGLYMGDVLVEVMTFGKPRYNRNYEWELLRLCTHCDYKIVGGAERLYKHFVKSYSPKSIISYCDNSKFNGGVYKRLGLSLLRLSKPSKHWWNGKRHITDNFLRQRGFDQLFGANYGKGTDNNELMLEHGFLPIYDCGQMTFVVEF